MQPGIQIDVYDTAGLLIYTAYLLEGDPIEVFLASDEGF